MQRKRSLARLPDLLVSCVIVSGRARAWVRYWAGL
jgi:hypothetical protein